jgi:methionyl-tRNA formyltransferase
MRIVFMGTPDLAAWCLGSLLDAGYDIAGVVTAPDKPAGRGRRLQQSAVKQLAMARELPVLQPVNLKSSEFIDTLRLLQPDLQVVIAFRMLPEAVWALPPLGTFNMHASYLPEYRGAAPINHAIINGEKETGVSTFLLDHAIDTGNILFRERIPIEDDDTAGSLHEKIKPHAAAITIRTIESLASGKAKPIPQSDLIRPGTKTKSAPKIFKEDCRIDWNKPCQEVVNLVRGLNPSPGAFCEIDDGKGGTIMMKIFEAEAMIQPHNEKPGSFNTDNVSTIRFAAADGHLLVKKLQLPGKKAMQTDELLRGFRF